MMLVMLLLVLLPLSVAATTTTDAVCVRLVVMVRLPVFAAEQVARQAKGRN
jgi:hypothetical protein